MIKLDEFPRGVIHGTVLIRPEEVETEQKTASGLILTADTSKPKPYIGTVILSADDTIVNAGDRVVFNAHAGVEYEISGEVYLLMREEGNVQAIL